MPRYLNYPSCCIVINSLFVEHVVDSSSLETSGVSVFVSREVRLVLLLAADRLNQFTVVHFLQSDRIWSVIEVTCDDKRQIIACLCPLLTKIDQRINLTFPHFLKAFFSL